MIALEGTGCWEGNKHGDKLPVFAAVKKGEAKGRQHRGRQQAQCSRLRNDLCGCVVQNGVCQNQRTGSKERWCGALSHGCTWQALLQKRRTKKGPWGSRQPPHRHRGRVAGNDAWGDTCLTSQRTHIIPGITSHTDTTRYRPRVSKHSHTWSSTVACDGPQICLAAGARRAPTWGLFCQQRGNWEQESDTAASFPASRPGSLSSSKWSKWASCRSRLVGGDSGTPRAVLLTALALTPGLWPPRFSKVPLNRT